MVTKGSPSIQQCRSQRIALRARGGVGAPQTGFHQHVLVRKTQPRVIGTVHLDPTAGFAEDRRHEIGEFQKRINHLFGVVTAFPVSRNRGQTTGNRGGRPRFYY